LNYQAPTIAAGAFAIVTVTITDTDAKSVVVKDTMSLEIVTAPAITVSNATNSITSAAAIRPFAAGDVTIADDDLLHDTKNSGTITLVDSAGSPTDAQGTLNGCGLQKVAGAVETYAMNSTSTLSFRNDLQQLVFSPLLVAAGTSLATGFKP
jgi:hypothetical protein